MQIEPQSPIHSSARVLQHNGKRISVKLEDVFWEQLDEIASNQGQTLSLLVHQALKDAPPFLNKTSALRVFCLKNIQRKIHAAELNQTTTNLTGFLTACPFPVFVLSMARKITFHNRAFKDTFLAQDPDDSNDFSGGSPRLTFSQPINRVFSYLNTHPLSVVTGQMGFTIGGESHYNKVRYALINKTHLVVFVEQKTVKEN